MCLIARALQHAIAPVCGGIMYRILMCAAAGALFISSQAVAQQKQEVSFKIPTENSKYIVSQNVDVGDAPNHIVRLFDTRVTIPNNAATVNGLKLVEILSRGIGDLTNGHGGGVAYFVFVAENGDKFFSRNNIAAQQVSGKLSALLAGPITGGTGKFAGIQGTIREFTNFDPSPGGIISNTQYDIEYSIGK
jgi:hypothetical protein